MVKRHHEINLPPIVKKRTKPLSSLHESEGVTHFVILWAIIEKRQAGVNKARGRKDVPVLNF